eukprot:UN02379
MKRAEEVKHLASADSTSLVVQSKEEKELLATHRKEKLKLIKRFETTFSDATPTSSKKKDDCLICYSEPGAVGMTTKCEHYFCNDCVKRSLDSIIETGQFPAVCPMCRAENKKTLNYITKGVLRFFVDEDLIP